MIAQAILSLLLCSVLIYAWAEYRRSPVVALMSLVASLVGLYFVWIPSHTTRVAEFIGIGRGADLIMYLWICISLIVLLNLHLKLRSQHEVITALARAIALANADSATEGARLRSTEHETAKPAIPLARDASHKEPISTVRTSRVIPPYYSARRSYRSK
jgi:small membrane protein